MTKPNRRSAKALRDAERLLWAAHELYRDRSQVTVQAFALLIAFVTSTLLAEVERDRRAEQQP